MRINNITPGTDEVQVQVEVDWNSPLPTRIQVEVNPPSGTQ